MQEPAERGTAANPASGWFPRAHATKRLIAFLAGVLLLVTGFAAYSLWQEMMHVEDGVQANALERSREVALQIDAFISATDRMLTALALAPATRTQDAGVVTAMLAELLKTHPEYANIWATRADGWNYANPLRNPQGKPIYIGDRAYFKEAMASGTLSIQSIPDSRQNPTKFAVVMSRAVRAPDGATNGTIQAGFEMLPIQKLLYESTLPEGSVVTIVDENGYVIARSTDPEKWVGSKIDASSVWAAMQSKDSGVFEARFLDGVERIAGYSSTRLARWKVIEGMPHASAYAVLWPRLARLFAVLLIPVLALVYLASRVARTAVELDTARIRAEQAQSVAQEATRAKDRFLAMLSHEMRNPLSPILAAVQFMQRNPALTDDMRVAADVIERNVNLEVRLIDDLLDISRIVQGKLQLERRALDVATVIQRAAETAKPQIEARRLHFSVEIDGGPHHVYADPVRLQQVIWNLLNNAVKFTAAGGSVAIRCRSGDGRVMMEVADNGIGIEPGALERIFDEFEQGNAARVNGSGGLGLGLAIAKRLVELHEGTISAQSEGRGKGSTFRVSLPVVTV